MSPLDSFALLSGAILIFGLGVRVGVSITAEPSLEAMRRRLIDHMVEMQRKSVAERKVREDVEKAAYNDLER